MKGGFMEVFFYKVPLCPRCLAAERHLKHLLAGRDVSLHTLNMLVHRKAARADGINLVPAIRVEDRVLSGIWLSEERIRDFLEEKNG